MLVLTRKPGQSVFIGDSIKITLHGIRGNQVRIGIDAPSHVRIYREEIFNQIVDENKSAATDIPTDLGDIAKSWSEGRVGALSVLKKHSTKKAKPEDEDES